MTIGQTQTVDAGLKLGGSIEGTVWGVGGPLADACVSTVDAVTGGQGAGVCTDRDGTYHLGGVPDGDFVLDFSGPRDSAYIHEFFKDAATIDEATTVTMSGAQALTGFDATLAKGGQISGTVTDAATGQAVGQEFQDWCYVTVFTLDDRYAGYACPATDGSYTTSGLAPGDYKVQFRLYQSPYAEQWYDGQPDFESATTVPVVAESVTSDIDGALQSVGPTGALDGTVTSEAGDPLAGVCAEVYRAEGSSISYWGGDCTDDSGTWSLPYVLTGTYKVSYEVYDLPFLSEWYDDAANSVSAALVTVDEGTTQHLESSLTRGATVSGTVTDSSGAPLEDVCIDLVDASTLEVINEGWGCTDAAGHYATTGAPAGDYYVRFTDYGGSHPSQYYSDGMAAAGSGTVVTLGDAEDVTGINQALSAGGTMSGTLSTSDGSSPADLCVFIYTDAQLPIDNTCTDESGAWESGSLPPGSYRVQFEGEYSGMAWEWYDNQPDFASATPVDVQLGQDAAGIDATMEPEAPATNQAPTATNVSVSTDFGTPVAVALDGMDPDGDELTYTHTSPAHGSLSGSGASLTYTPATGYDGADSFDYTVTDPSGENATATVSVTVRAAVTDPGTGGGGTGGGGTGGGGPAAGHRRHRRHRHDHHPDAPARRAGHQPDRDGRLHPADRHRDRDVGQDHGHGHGCRRLHGRSVRLDAGQHRNPCRRDSAPVRRQGRGRQRVQLDHREAVRPHAGDAERPLVRRHQLDQGHAGDVRRRLCDPDDHRHQLAEPRPAHRHRVRRR